VGNVVTARILCLVKLWRILKGLAAEPHNEKIFEKVETEVRKGVTLIIIHSKDEKTSFNLFIK